MSDAIDRIKLLRETYNLSISEAKRIDAQLQKPEPQYDKEIEDWFKASIPLAKPWGHEIIYAHTKNYVGKLLHINQGHRLSMQFHQIKEETILIKSGEMILEIYGNEKTLPEKLLMRPNSVFHITPGTIHRMVAVTDVDVLEISTIELQDCIRISDDYGRTDEEK